MSVHPAAKTLIFLFSMGFFLGLPTHAHAGEEVASEVDIDATGKDAADARDKAMAQGKVDALLDLLSKFTRPDQAKAMVGNLSAEQVSAIIHGTEVTDEKIAEKTYRAHLTVNFDGDQISALLGKTGTAGADENAGVGAFLIVPVYEEDGSTLLWESANPWRDVWKTVGLETGSGDLVVPFGDALDSNLLDAKSAESATYASLAPLTVRYGVSDIIILQAKLERNPDMVLTVIKRRMNHNENEVNLYTYRADPQETRDVLLARAAHDLADIVQQRKVEEQQTKTVRGGEHATVMALASVPGIGAWTQLRAKLTAMPMIDRLEILAISPRQVDLVIHYRGSADALARAITAQQIRLVQNPNYWVISRD